MMDAAEVSRRTQKQPHGCFIGCIVLLAMIVSSIYLIEFEYAQVGPDDIWENHSVDLDIQFLRDVEFYNASYGLAVGKGNRGGVIILSANGGVDWEVVLRPDGEIYDISIVEQGIIWLAGSHGLYLSTNGGINWTLQYIDQTTRAVTFMNNTHGLASTSEYLISSDDGGMTWNEVESLTYERFLTQIQFVNDTTVWTCGYSGVYFSSDSGLNWVQKRTTDIDAISPITATEVWALGFGSIYHTADGTSWSYTPSPTPFYRDSWTSPRDIEFVDSVHGWVVGSQDTAIMYTPNGGKSWYQQDSTNSLMSVDFINETHGWAVGWDGAIHRTTKGDRLGRKSMTTGIDFPVYWMGYNRVPISVVIWNIVLPFFYPVYRLVLRIQHRREQELEKPLLDDMGSN